MHSPRHQEETQGCLPHLTYPFPEFRGYINRHFYAAKDVRVVIEVELKVPPLAKRPKTVYEDLMPRRVSGPIQDTSNSRAAWELIGNGAFLLTATILTDFLFGIGLFDDVVTIPAALSMMGYGASRLIYPVLVRNAGTFAAYQTVKSGTNMYQKNWAINMV